MAQRSRRQPPSRRSSGGTRRAAGPPEGRRSGGGGGGRRPPPRRGNDNSGLIIGLVAIALIGGGVLFAVMQGSGKKKVKPATPVAQTPRPSATGPRLPDAPTKPPPPPLDSGAKDNALVAKSRIKSIATDARRHFRASQDAKQAGNDDLWQSELTKAKGFFDQANDIWNGIVEQMPEELPHWDKELVAEYWLAKESQTLAKLVRDCPGISKQRR